jgi:hypothetical protein
VATIDAESSVPRSGQGPTFIVDPGPNLYYAVEVAYDPDLLAGSSRPLGARTPGFYGSWDEGPLRSSSRYILPDRVWTAIRGTDRLYYRAWTSALPDEWQHPLTTTQDDQLEQAPFVRVFPMEFRPDDDSVLRLADDLWDASLRDDGLRDLSAKSHLDVLVVRHSTSPRRPFDPRAVEWVVIASSLPAFGPSVEIIVLRIEFQTLALQHSSRQQAVIDPVEADGAAAAINAVFLADSVDRHQVLGTELEQIGQCWLWWNPSPSPGGETGGTFVVHQPSGLLVYAATTAWEGGQHLVP